MEFSSINPFDGKVIRTYTALTDAEVFDKLNISAKAFVDWRKVPIKDRAARLSSAGRLLRENMDEYARMITLEMGKPIKEARAEVNKCAWACDYYAENAASFLADEIIATDAQKSFVRNDPLGTVLAIMPWNYPFWQVFRFAAPALMAGNTAVLKHAPNVFGCATLIESIFLKAGFPSGVFQNLIVHHDQVESIIAHPAVKAVTLTGSERAGAAVASLAGRYIMKSVLELGGSNAFIVWEDADIDEAVKTAVASRMGNCGQSCIAAKRIILVAGIYDAFLSKFTEAVAGLSHGDPFSEATQIGPMARKDLAANLQLQMQESIKQGAKLLMGGKHRDCFHEPTILTNVTPGMPAFDEETFGPLAAIIKATDAAHAFDLAAQSKFGLGVTVFTSDIEKALAFAHLVEDGSYFINELVKSDPRLPFGGTGHSGYGRELSKDGMMEFINRKTIYVNA